MVHMHTHTHAHTYTCVRVGGNRYHRLWRPVHTHTHTHIETHTHTQTRTVMHRMLRTHTREHARARMPHTRADVCTYMTECVCVCVTLASVSLALFIACSIHVSYSGLPPCALLHSSHRVRTALMYALQCMMIQAHMRLLMCM